MDEVRNPFAPGAGSAPPALAGRDEVIENARISLLRVLQGRHGRAQMLLGLRGTGKTVLLNRIEEMAEETGYVTTFIEAPDNQRLAELIYPKIHQILRKLSLVEAARTKAHSGMRALRGFASAFKIKVGDVSISVDPEPGVADSGNLEMDLVDLFLQVGAVAKAAAKGWAIFLDEVQYLSVEELSALIVAIHRVNQKNLPVIFFGAGLPQIAGLSGNAKSYSERLFIFPPIGPLDDDAAKAAIVQPIESEGEKINSKAVAQLIHKTQGYPYFLQEWGFQSWNIASDSPINISDVEKASIAAMRRLDEGFFRVRYDRLTPKEKEYVFAMARLGDGPYRSGDIAHELDVQVQTLGPRRVNIIKKGMIYSPGHGDVDFTVPMFADYLRRSQAQSA